MNIEVYCDESYTDLFCSQDPSAEYLMIGGLWLQSENRQVFKSQIHALREKHGVGGEAKWTKVTKGKLPFYTDLVDWFINQGDALRFRCIAVKRKNVNLMKFHQNDRELAFYKFYYQMIHHWIYDFNNYIVFCDYKSNRKNDRLPVLQNCLNNANMSAQVEQVQAIRSADSVLMQLADVLTGAASAKLNAKLREVGPKRELVSYLEQRLGRPIRGTWATFKKFNVFIIDLPGGW